VGKTHLVKQVLEKVGVQVLSTFGHGAYIQVPSAIKKGGSHGGTPAV